MLAALARNHALVDGNKRLAWSSAVVFCRMNGHDLRPTTIDAAYAVVVAAATGDADVTVLAAALSRWIHS
ncbi:MAG TPA: hypothetical protein GXZ30_04000 [Propionibacterium sp.]|nr:hypothetical protein [Propionibacterium sp.]